MKFFLVLSFLYSFDGAASFDFKIESRSEESNKIKQSDIEILIESMQTEYFSEISDLGGILKINYDSNNPSMSAFAKQEGHTWAITINAGIARHKDIDLDGIAGILCHEMGHHLGGAPKKIREGIPNWSSVEGQADYYATTKCLRRVLAKRPSTPIEIRPVHETLIKACEKSSHLEFHLCLRIGLSSWQIARLAAKLNRHEVTPSFKRPSKVVVTRTTQSHPSAQCRLDTFFQGLICPVDTSIKFDELSAVTGSCHEDLGHQFGMRPSCWYAD